MKTVIAALNSKYIHMSLAPWYLKAACSDLGEIKVIETTVNRSSRDIIRAIYNEKPDILGFSCYIFNITQVEDIVNNIKKLLPDMAVVFGGPEVSYDAENVLNRCAGLDYVICGEGETALRELIKRLSHRLPVDDIPGLALRLNGRVNVNPPNVPDLSKIVSPYTAEMLQAAAGKIIYFESSRGCPYRCAYCLSSVSGGVRFFPLDYVRSELLRVMQSPARQIKFVDRTFNCNLPRAKEIIRFIIDTAAQDQTGIIRGKNYHFEAAADLFDDELIGLLGTAPHGLIQLEIGIQSLNGAVLAGSDRVTDIVKCTKNIKRLLEPCNIHIHLDLIAGLPQEDYASLARSFDGIYSLHPHTIQLGFLKLLKGSRLSEQAETLGLTHSDLPPYEILSTPCLSFEELNRLTDIAETVERLYNSGKYISSLRFVAACFPTPFRFFEAFSQYLAQQSCFDRSLSLRELYDRFADFADQNLCKKDAVVFAELLKFDYFSSDNACNPPAGLKRIYNPNVKSLYLSQKQCGGAGSRVHFETFAFDPMLYIKTGAENNQPVVFCFDYGKRDPVSGLYDVKFVSV